MIVASASTPTSSVDKRCRAVRMEVVSHGLEARASAARTNAMERAPALSQSLSYTSRVLDQPCPRYASRFGGRLPCVAVRHYVL